MTAPSADLISHAGHLLAGTGLPAEDAARIAADRRADVPPAAADAANALRAGWAAARDQGQPR